jgi:uncharacterized membrane protein
MSDDQAGRPGGRWKRGLQAAGLVLAVAALSYGLALWALPRVIMAVVLQRAAGPAPPAAYWPPLTDHRARRIVLPSPDLAYATCVFDLSLSPLRVRAAPRWPHYWSLAFYADNTDNFLVVNDSQARDGGIDLLLLPPGSPATRRTDVQVVVAPRARGLLLMRVLVPDRETDAAGADAARRTLNCQTEAAVGS